MNRSNSVPDFPYETHPAVTEPFRVARSPARLLFDFAVMISGMKAEMKDLPVLDFGAGSGWITELLARMGHQVTAFDVHGDLEGCLQRRIEADLRIVPSLIEFRHGDGHAMPLNDASFGHVLCYDTLHHMHSYPAVFSEFARVLKPGGRAIFVEQGARHSQSPETIEFLRAQKRDDPTWIERDVVLEEIDAIARGVGFTGLTIRPMPHPDTTFSYSTDNWRAFRAGNAVLRSELCDQLASLNFNERVIFHCDRTS